MYTMCVLIIIPSYHARRVGRHGWNRKTLWLGGRVYNDLAANSGHAGCRMLPSGQQESLELDVHSAAILVEMCPERLG